MRQNNGNYEINYTLNDILRNCIDELIEIVNNEEKELDPNRRIHMEILEASDIYLSKIFGQYDELDIGYYPYYRRLIILILAGDYYENSYYKFKQGTLESDNVLLNILNLYQMLHSSYKKIIQLFFSEKFGLQIIKSYEEYDRNNQPVKAYRRMDEIYQDEQLQYLLSINPFCIFDYDKYFNSDVGSYQLFIDSLLELYENVTDLFVFEDGFDTIIDGENEQDTIENYYEETSDESDLMLRDLMQSTLDFAKSQHDFLIYSILYKNMNSVFRSMNLVPLERERMWSLILGDAYQYILVTFALRSDEDIDAEIVGPLNNELERKLVLYLINNKHNPVNVIRELANNQVLAYLILKIVISKNLEYNRDKDIDVLSNSVQQLIKKMILPYTDM